MNDSPLDANVVAQFSSQQIQTYFTLYLKNASNLIDNMMKDLSSGNNEVLRQHAHKLKGSSMVVGAVELKNLAGQIEDSVRENKPLDSASIQQLRQQFQVLAEYLKKRYNLERG